MGASEARSRIVQVGLVGGLRVEKRYEYTGTLDRSPSVMRLMPGIACYCLLCVL